MTCFWCCHRNGLGCCVGGRNRRDFGVGDRSWLDFSVPGRDYNWVGFVRGSKITWLRVWIEVNVVFVSGSKGNCLVFKVGVEMDLTSVLGLKLPWFCAGDRNWHGFSMRLVFWARVKIVLFFVCGSKLIVCSVSIKIELVFMMVETDLSVVDRTLTWFQCRDEIDH